MRNVFVIMKITFKMYMIIINRRLVPMIRLNDISPPLEINKIITLNPGEKKEIGTSCVYYDLFDELFLGIRGYSYGCEPCNDTSKITYSVMGELRVD